MAVFDFEKLAEHDGHNIECVIYTDGDIIYSVGLECVDCNEPFLNFDNVWPYFVPKKEKNVASECSDDFYEVENIEWDLSEFTKKQKRSIFLPSKERIPAHICLEIAADYLSDKYGFCVLSFTESEN